MVIKSPIVFLLIAFIYLNSVLANEKGLKVNSNISKRDLLDDFIGNSRNLDDRNNDYNNETVCPTLTDCITCNSYTENKINCEWTNGKCNPQMNPGIQWYKYLEHCAQDDKFSNSKMQKFCNSVGEKIPFKVGNFTMPDINNRYSSNYLYCKWSYWGIEIDQYLLLQYYRNDYRHAFSIEGELIDGTPFNYNVSKDNFIFNSLGVKYFTLHFFSFNDFYYSPFVIEMSYEKLSRSAMSIFLSVGTIVILIMLFSILIYRCYMGFKLRRQLRRESDRHQREINYIIANNPEVMVNFDQNLQAEENLKNKHKLTIEQLLQTDLKPIFYKEIMNEFNATCTICMEGFVEDTSEVTVLYCKHIFHHNCLKNWLFKNLTHPKCPNCNYNVIDKSSNHSPNNLNYPTFTNNNASHSHDNTYNNLNQPNPNSLNVNIQQNSSRIMNNNIRNNNRIVSIGNNRIYSNV